MLANQGMYLRQILWMAMKGEQREITLRTPTMRYLEERETFDFILNQTKTPQKLQETLMRS